MLHLPVDHDLPDVQPIPGYDDLEDEINGMNYHFCPVCGEWTPYEEWVSSQGQCQYCVETEYEIRYAA